MSDRPDSYFNGEMKPSFDDGVDPSPASEAVELEIVSPPPRPALQSATLRQGPGLLETLGWVAGFFMAQLLLGALFFILYIVEM